MQLSHDLPRKEIKRIVILVENPFCKRDYDRFGVEIFRENAFETEVWEISPITRPNACRQVSVPDPVVYKGYHLFFRKKDVVKSIVKLQKESVIISYVKLRKVTFFLYEALSTEKIPYGNVISGSLPSFSDMQGKLSLCDRIGKKLRLALNRSIMINCNWILSKLSYLRPRTHSLSPLFIILQCGETGISRARKIQNKTTKIIRSHSYDYDIYMSLRDERVSPDSGTYAVFLDEYLPFHPDYAILGLEPYSSAEEYYPVLCQYFDRFESQHNLEIIIAAHPRSAYENHPDYFNGRRSVRGKTAELVKGAKVILIHSSTSVNFVVLFRKPMVFLTTDRLNCSSPRYSIEAMSYFFNLTPVNINMPYQPDENKIRTIDNELYARYIHQYIKTKDSPCEAGWKIVADRLSFCHEKR